MLKKIYLISFILALVGCGNEESQPPENKKNETSVKELQRAQEKTKSMKAQTKQAEKEIEIARPTQEEALRIAAQNLASTLVSHDQNMKKATIDLSFQVLKGIDTIEVKKRKTAFENYKNRKLSRSDILVKYFSYNEHPTKEEMESLEMDELSAISKDLQAIYLELLKST